MKDQNEITELLQAVNLGDCDAMEALIQSIHSELKRLAGALMKKERSGHTLQPTALVNEAYIRLSRGEAEWENRAHFFGAAARAMRRILIEHARKKASQKRGGEFDCVTFDDLALVSIDKRLDLLALDEALDALEKQDQRLLRVVELRYFAGLSIEQTAEVLEVSPATVKRDWTFARAWLYDRIASAGEDVKDAKLSRDPQ